MEHGIIISSTPVASYFEYVKGVFQNVGKVAPQLKNLHFSMKWSKNQVVSNFVLEREIAVAQKQLAAVF